MVGCDEATRSTQWLTSRVVIIALRGAHFSASSAMSKPVQVQVGKAAATAISASPHPHPTSATCKWEAGA